MTPLRTMPRARQLGRRFVQLGRRFVQLGRQPWRRQRLALEAAFVLTALKAAMSALPYRRWQHLVEVGGSGSAGELAQAELDDVLWAVDRVARSTPGLLNCLPRALAARHMLQRRGAKPALCIGVMRPENGSVAAHAWLEIDGEVVLGHVPDLDRFQRLKQWPRHAPPA